MTDRLKVKDSDQIESVKFTILFMPLTNVCTKFMLGAFAWNLYSFFNIIHYPSLNHSWILAKGNLHILHLLCSIITVPQKNYGICS